MNQAMRARSDRACVAPDIDDAELLREVEGSHGWALDGVCLPAKEVGGGSCCGTLARDGSFLVGTEDVSGRGSLAALLTHPQRSVLGKTRGGSVHCACALFCAYGSATIPKAWGQKDDITVVSVRRSL